MAVIIFISFALIAGCSSWVGVVNSATKLGQESDRLEKMNAADVEKIVSADIDVERIKGDPEGVLGQYVKLRGKANLEGTKDFPIQPDKSKIKREDKDQGPLLLLDDCIFVVVLDKHCCNDLKTGDDVEILGLVSESRFLRATSELYPKEKIPDFVTVIAKTVTKIEPPAQTAPPSSDAAGNVEGVSPSQKEKGK